jgi:1-aminocyclopropane-1-carboxylate deaminase/D-cysteine desulfhydrase-like pyridoxal-dependent ACC family enzyme
VGAPTPVERLPRFEAAIGSPYPIFIKRDDAIPFGFGGNKVRKLEVVMAEARAAGATAVITCGGVQSNHCRATAAAAVRAGIACHLVLSGAEPATLSGNTRLDDLFGATLHFVPGRLDRAPRMTALEEEIAASGGKAFLIPLGASTSMGAVGLALGLFELLDQGARPDVIVHASSSGGTQAGLVAGATLAGFDTRIIGVSADETAEALGGIVRELGNGVLRLAGSEAPLAGSKSATASSARATGFPPTPRGKRSACSRGPRRSWSTTPTPPRHLPVSLRSSARRKRRPGPRSCSGTPAVRSGCWPSAEAYRRPLHPPPRLPQSLAA